MYITSIRLYFEFKITPQQTNYADQSQTLIIILFL